MMRLLADAYTRTERHAAARSAVARSAVARSAVAPHQEPRLVRSSDAPSDELVDIYSAALIAVPVALFLRWMWP